MSSSSVVEKAEKVADGTNRQWNTEEPGRSSGE